MRKTISVFIYFILSCYVINAQQLNFANQKKFSVYKSAINTNFIKEGVNGINITFSCEYLFSEEEYAEMTDKERKTYFVFYAQLFNQNNEPVYYPFEFSEFSREKSKTPVHFTIEDAYAPQVKAQGRRNTGITLFIPFAHLDIPEGTHSLNLSLNSFSKKTEKKFENFFIEKITVIKPPTFWINLKPKNISIYSKTNKKIDASQVEEDLSIIRGTNLKHPEIFGSGNVNLQKSVSFIYSDGDVSELRVHKNTENVAKVNDYALPAIKDLTGKLILNFDNKPSGDFPLDVNQKSLLLKNSSLQWNIFLEKQKIPAVKLTYPKIKPYITYQGVTGMSLSFEWDVIMPPNLPPLQIAPYYGKNDGLKQLAFQNGEIMSGDVKLDTTGNITLKKNIGKAEIFYSFAGLLLSDPNIALQSPKLVAIKAKLQNNLSVITQKQLKQGFQVTIVRNTNLENVVLAKDTIYKDERGLKITIPYKLPESYFRVLKKDISLKLTPTSPDDKGKFVNMFKRCVFINDNAKRLLLDSNDVKSISYLLLKNNGPFALFLPYTTMGQKHVEPLPFTTKILINQKSSTKPVDIGNTETNLKFVYDQSKVKLMVVGLKNVKFKKQVEGKYNWQIRSEKAIIYHSPDFIINEKELKSNYAQYYTLHKDDKVILEILHDEKVIVQWIINAKELSGEKIIELEDGKNKEILDPLENIKNVTFNISAN